MPQWSELELTQYQVGQGILSWNRQNAATFVASQVAPEYAVTVKEGKLVEDDVTENILTDMARSPGQAPGEVESEVNAGQPFVTTDYALREVITQEDIDSAASAFGMDVAAQKGAKLAKRWAILQEAYVSSLFRSVNAFTRAYGTTMACYDSYGNQVVTLAGAQHWNLSTSTPFDDISTALKWFSDNNSVQPNVIIVPEGVALRLRENADYKSEYSMIVDQQPIGGLVRNIRGLNVITPSARYGDKTGEHLIWGTDVWIGYVDGFGNGTSGHAVRVHQTGQDEGLMVYPDPDVGKRAVKVQVRNGKWDFKVSKLGGSVAGYLIRNAISA